MSVSGPAPLLLPPPPYPPPKLRGVEDGRRWVARMPATEPAEGALTTGWPLPPGEDDSVPAVVLERCAEEPRSPLPP